MDPSEDRETPLLCERCERCAREQASGPAAGPDDGGSPAARWGAEEASPACPDCAAMRRVLATLVEASAAFEVPDPPSGYWARFSSRVAERLDAPPAAARRMPIGRWATVAGLAAAAGLAGWLVLVGRLPGSGRTPGNEPIGGVSSAPASNTATASATPSEADARHPGEAGPERGPGAASLADPGLDARDLPSEAALLARLQGASGDTLESWRDAMALSASGRASEVEISKESLGTPADDGVRAGDEARVRPGSLEDEVPGVESETSPYELFDRMQPHERRHVLEVIRGDMG